MPAVLAAYNWAPNTDRYRKLALFVDAFFTKFPTFQNPPFHPEVEGGLAVGTACPTGSACRSPQQWLESHGVEPCRATRFEEFLKQNPATAANVQTDADKEALFKQFQAWEAERSARAQAHPPAQR